jgi:hypothetical protein
MQSKLMQQRAREILRDWSFPHHQLLRLIVALIAQRCVERTLEPSAPLSSGANAYGVRQPEFDRVHSTRRRISRGSGTIFRS